MVTDRLRAKFENGFTPEPMSGCWLWDHPLRRDGYAQVEESRGKSVLAHRLAWTIHRSEIPAGQCVLHKCDVRCCVNPDHLFLGTYADNNLDARLKGRHRAPKGTAHPKAKLTLEQVAHIRQRVMRGVDYARLYGVSKVAISRIHTGKNWAGVQT